MKRAAVDTGALLALASTRDQYHMRALATEAHFRKSGGRWVGSTLVLGEFHGHLIRRTEPDRARKTIAALMSDTLFEWRDASSELIRAGVDRWLTRFADQRFSLTDAVTFELMEREGISEAFAYDDHFRVAGFQLLD